MEILANSVVDRCSSTNDLAKTLAEAGYPHGTWISARVQEAGRGRLGRKWNSTEGNLFLTLIARIKRQDLWSWIPLTTAVGITRALRQTFPDLDICVKWPNDLLLRGAKLGGILCEGSSSSKGTYILIGIGLNCAFTPEGLDQPGIDLTSAQGGKLWTADALRMKVIEAVLDEIDILNLRGKSQVLQGFQDWSAYPIGTRVEWGSSAQQTGIFTGLGHSGELRVKIADGQEIGLFAEDVRVRYSDNIR